MKVKIILVVAICMTLLLGTVGKIVLIEVFNPVASDEFQQFIFNGKEMSLTKEELLEYKQAINQELSVVKDSKSLERIYFMLGIITALEEDYKASTNYLLKVLSDNNLSCDKVQILTYRTLATNYLAMGEVEKGYYYFQLAYQSAYPLEDNDQLKASLYQTFSEFLLKYTTHTSFPIYLLSEAISLTNSDIQEIHLRETLATFYERNNFWELSVHELIKALELSISSQYEEEEMDILRRLSALFFTMGAYPDSIKALSNYFQLAENQIDVLSLSLWLHNYYFLYGYEGLEKELDRIEFEGLEAVQQQYPAFWDFQHAYFLLLEGRFDESEKYLERLKTVENIDTFSEVAQIMFRKLNIDFQYAEGSQAVDYVSEYRELLYDIEALSDTTGLQKIVIKSIVMKLLDLGDYETVYQYTMTVQKPVVQELEAMSSILSVIQDENVESTTGSSHVAQLILKVGGYFIATVVGAGLTYGAYRYNRYINLLNKLVRSSVLTEPVTKTLTKKALFEKLELEIGQNICYHFLLLDVINFGAYNTNFGYLEGDKLLREIADILRSYFPESYISRHQGQHFIIVVKNMSDEELSKLTLLMIDAISNSYEFDDRKQISCCVGISKGHIQSYLDIDEHIIKATKKLQVSKQRGNGIYTM